MIYGFKEPNINISKFMRHIFEVPADGTNMSHVEC